MPNKIKEVKPPSGLRRLLWRAPIWLYRWHLGGLLGGRFLLLHHTGRVSGKPRQNVLEVVDHIPEEDIYYIASGFGSKSDWFRNIRRQPDVSIEVGRRRSSRTAVILEPDASGEALAAYAQRNPRAAKELMRICGYQVDGSREAYIVLGRDHIPFIRLEPRQLSPSTI